jgi:DNA-binding response OmpR family regulator
MATQERPTILLVEDDRATRDMLQFALRFDGFTVLAASDGLVALRLLEHHLPDAIVLGLDVPHVSGIDVQREVMAHAETSAIPIVVVIGRESKTPAGVFQVVRRPITADVLLKAVRKALSPDGRMVPGDDAHRRRS